MKLNLEGKIAIITGGTKGIGLAIVKSLEKEGCQTHSISRTSTLSADLSKEEGLSDAKSFIKQIRPNILINNVGGVGRRPIEKIEYNINEAYRMNMRPMIELTIAALKNSNLERVITISSIYGTEAGLNPWFTSSKAYQIAFMKEMSKTYKQVTFNCVSPGHIDIGRHDDDIVYTYGKPEDVANLVTFLCSDLAKHINGENIRVDGGESCSF